MPRPLALAVLLSLFVTTARAGEAVEDQSRASFSGHGDHVCDVAFSPDGKTLASAGADGTVRLWSVESRKAAGVIGGHEKLVEHVAFSPDGRFVAAVSREFPARPDDDLYLNPADWGEGDVRLVLWDREKSRAVVNERPPDDVGRKGLVPRGELVRLRRAASKIAPWGADVSEVVALAVGNGRFRTMSPDGNLYLMLHGEYGGVGLNLHDVAAGKSDYLRHSNRDGAHAAFGTAGRFSPDGSMIATASTDGTILLWDVKTQTPVRTIRDSAWSLAFSPDGTLLATTESAADRGNDVKLWNVRTGKRIATFTGHTASVWCVTFSPDGRTLATGSRDGTVKLWDAARHVRADADSKR